jgi:hypothetical protein
VFALGNLGKSEANPKEGRKKLLRSEQNSMSLIENHGKYY